MPFVNPLPAIDLNERYYELTEKDHPVFAKNAERILRPILEQKDLYLRTERYSRSEIDKVEECLYFLERSKNDPQKDIQNVVSLRKETKN